MIASPRRRIVSLVICVLIKPGQTALTRIFAVGVFERGGLGQPDDAVLGGDIGRRGRQADQPGDRAGVDDRAAALRLHLLQIPRRMHSQTPFRLTAIMRSKDSSDQSAVFLPEASTW